MQGQQQFFSCKIFLRLNLRKALLEETVTRRKVSDEIFQIVNIVGAFVCSSCLSIEVSTLVFHKTDLVYMVLSSQIILIFLMMIAKFFTAGILKFSVLVLAPIMME